jgi:crossover junction endodeoxyribonuclease RusA
VTARTWELVFPWPTPPLSANHRMHWSRRAALTKQIRSTTYLLAMHEHIPSMGRVSVELEWFVKDRRRRDSDNTYPTFKACCDGIVDAKIVPDDIPRYMDKLAPKITNDPYTKPRVVLTIKELA